ncbi:MAG: hypothetical protein IPP14_05820 [Planctomycetes bacterium]|nr:hypothetical protein [Planctomycetota bacterium]
MKFEPYWLNYAESIQLRQARLKTCPKCGKSALALGQVRIGADSATQIVLCSACKWQDKLTYDNSKQRGG